MKHLGAIGKASNNIHYPNLYAFLMYQVCNMFVCVFIQGIRGMPMKILKIVSTKFTIHPIDISLLGCCTRFSCTLKKGPRTRRSPKRRSGQTHEWTLNLT